MNSLCCLGLPRNIPSRFLWRETSGAPKWGPIKWYEASVHSRLGTQMGDMGPRCPPTTPEGPNIKMSGPSGPRHSPVIWPAAQTDDGHMRSRL